MSTLNSSGVVSEVYPNFCKVILDEDQSRKLLCSYRKAKINDKEAEWRQRSPVSIGDRVSVKILGSQDGVVEEIFPRKNSIQRRAPGREGKVLHTLAANVDLVVIVSSYSDPDFSPGLIDRFLVATEAAEITPLLVINKMDLALQSEKPWQLYEDIGTRCLPISTKNDLGLETLRELLQSKTSVFCGHSGVGKTSLLEKLFGKSIGKVGAISKSTGKGKHTTSVSTLIQADATTRFIDTPGIKEFGLFNVDPKKLIQFFPELYELQLKHEPYEHLPRYQNYIRIKAALDDEGR